MPSFASVLADVETKCLRRDDSCAIDAPFRSVGVCPIAGKPVFAGTTDIARAYGAEKAVEEAERAASDRIALLREVNAASRSAADLRALRRRIARQLHPDGRRGASDCGALAEINAAIDAALKTIRDD